MKKKIIIIIVTIALLLSIPGTLLVWGLALPAQYGGAFLGELKHKVRMLEVTPGPRIILVGGSGAAFGVDSALMERELPGYSVVNFGMYAALGTTVMLDLSQPHIREGDIVLLIPEQQEQTLSDWFDPAVMWQGLDGAFDLLRLLPKDKLERLAGAFPAFPVFSKASRSSLKAYTAGIPSTKREIYLPRCAPETRCLGALTPAPPSALTRIW